MNDGLNYKLLIDRLRNLPDETEWSEFKVNIFRELGILPDARVPWVDWSLSCNSSCNVM